MKLRSMSEARWDEIERALRWGGSHNRKASSPGCDADFAAVYCDAIVLRDVVLELRKRVDLLARDNEEMANELMSNKRGV